MNADRPFSTRHDPIVEARRAGLYVDLPIKENDSMAIERINPRGGNCSAAVFGDLVFLSGVVADDKSLNMKGQTEQVLRKIDAVLAKAATNKTRLFTTTVYMPEPLLTVE